MAVATVVFSQSAMSADSAKVGAKDQVAPNEFKHQTKCPVMGGDIDSTAYTDIQGQRVYHCCPMCSAKLKADPDKYFKEAAEQGILFENIQTNCPVSGEKLSKKEAYVDYQGRRVYFCCPDCIPDFNKDPQKYLKKLDEATSTDSTGSKGMQGMKMDHGCGGM